MCLEVEVFRCFTRVKVATTTKKMLLKTIKKNTEKVLLEKCTKVLKVLCFYIVIIDTLNSREQYNDKAGKG